VSHLKTRTYLGAFWSAVDALGARAVQFVIGIVLARLLLPEQFGLIGMLAIFIGITQALLDSGFGTALIQKKQVTQTDSSSVFFFNMAISFVLALSLWLAAPLIAVFYGQADLTWLTRALTLVVLFDAFSTVHTALLVREMNFKIRTKISLASGLGSGLLGITMAYFGFGVWSLVAQQVSRACLRSIMLWWLHNWRPKILFSLRSLRVMFKFGSRMLVSGLLDRVFRDLYYVVIGRLFSPLALGFYTRARKLEEMPSMTLVGVITRVSLPAFSSVQMDDARLRRGLRKALSLTALVSAPMMVGLAVVAEPLVLVLLTEKWLPSVPYLQLMCVLGVMHPLHALNLNILMAKGRSDLLLRLEVIKKVLIVISILVTWRWGIPALILGQIVVSVISYSINTHFTGRFLHYGGFEQFKDLAIYLLLAAIMGLGVHSVGLVDFPSEVLRLSAQILVGVGAYVTLCALIRPPAFRELLQTLREKLAGYKGSNRMLLRVARLPCPRHCDRTR